MPVGGATDTPRCTGQDSAQTMVAQSSDIIIRTKTDTMRKAFAAEVTHHIEALFGFQVNKDI